MQAIPKDLAKKLPISADAKKKRYSAEKIACFRRCMKKVGVKAQKECLKKCMTDKKKEVKSTDKIKQQKEKSKDKTTAKPERRSGGRGGGGGGGGKGGGAPRVRQPPIVPTQPTGQRTMQPPPLVTLKSKQPTEPKIPAPVIRVPDWSKRKKPSAKDLQRMEDEVFARYGGPAPAVPAGGVAPANPFRPTQSLDTNMKDGTPIPQVPLPPSPADVRMGMASRSPTPVRTPSPPDVRMGTPLPASDYGTDDEVTAITTPAPRDDSPSVANVFFVHPTSRGRPKRQQRTANARAQQLAQANVNVALGAGTPAQEALVDSSIVNQQRHNMISATRELMSSIPADRASPPAQPHSLQSSPVQSHPEMTQIPGARSSTSAYQGHNVDEDEPEALEMVLARSMAEITDGQVAGTTPARVTLKEELQDFNSRRRNTVAGTQQSARDATVEQRRRQNTHTRAMANARRVAQEKADELSQGAFNLARAKATVRAVDNQLTADNLQRAQQAVRVADAQIQARQAADVVTARIKDTQLQTQASIAQTLGGRKEQDILAEYSASVRNKAHRGFSKRPDSLENVDALLTNFARTPTPPSQSRGSLDDDWIGDWDGTPSPASTEPYVHRGDTPSPTTMTQTMLKREKFRDFAKEERAKLTSRYVTVPAIRYIGNSRVVGNGAGNGAGAVDRGDYISNTSNHQEEEKEEYDQQEFKSAE